MRSMSWVFVILALPTLTFGADRPGLEERTDRELGSLVQIYKGIHAAPELSHHEKQTASIVARELRSAGYSVTDHVGKYPAPELQGYGVVGVLKNGTGPTVLVRADMDALPVEEQTGVPYASHIRSLDDTGTEVPVMHACGHDIHVAVFIGTARLLAALKDRWSGTLVLVGQPSEEDRKSVV